MMNNTINGRTPEEIKKGLECCSQNTYTCGEGCPYQVECQRMGRSNDVILDALAYIQQLERERDEARNDLDTINYANTELHSAYDAMKRERDELLQKNQQLERERDAAVVQLKEVDVSSYFECAHCKHEELCDSPVWPCNDCDNEECPCHTCSEGSNWQWRGVEVAN